MKIKYSILSNPSSQLKISLQSIFHRRQHTQSKKIVILGATGETGKFLVPQSLAKGYEVTAVVRDAKKMSAITHPNLKLYEGDVFSSDSLAPAFVGQDAVISVLGFPKADDNTKMTKFTENMKAIIDAMRTAKVNRIITISAWYVDPESRKGQALYENVWSKIPGLTNTLNNEGEMETLLKNSKDLNHTIVRAPGLSWDEVTTREFLESDGYWVENSIGMIQRADVARFMLRTLEHPEIYSNKGVAITVQYEESEVPAVMESFKRHNARYTQADTSTR